MFIEAKTKGLCFKNLLRPFFSPLIIMRSSQLKLVDLPPLQEIIKNNSFLVFLSHTNYQGFRVRVRVRVIALFIIAKKALSGKIVDYMTDV